MEIRGEIRRGGGGGGGKKREKTSARAKSKTTELEEMVSAYVGGGLCV